MTEEVGTKECNRCGEAKPLDNFFNEPRVKSGKAGLCKGCIYVAQMQWKKDNPEKVIAGRKQYRQRQKDVLDPELAKKMTPKERARHKRQLKKWHAWDLMHSALRHGRLFKGNCEVCGTDVKVEGHHQDYSKPLEVTWLCTKHHVAWHVAERKRIREAVEAAKLHKKGTETA